MGSEFPVAVVSYAYRLPGGLLTDEDFWRLLSEREIVREPIEDRYGRGYGPLGRYSGPGRFASPYEGLIRDGAEWLIDRGFFGLSHDEMLVTNANTRLLLSCSAEALERAGWSMQSMRNSPTGVYLGLQVPSVASYRKMDGVDEYSVSGVSLAMMANRISYHFNLMGSSMAYCTACSAGLSALHSAVNSLRAGDCRQALVGSVHLLGSFGQSCGFNALGVISPDGKCHSFDAGANGYMRSEGAFIFAVKPLDRAEDDGDRILAVIEGTAVNAAGSADGARGPAQGRYITAPTLHSQMEVIGQACRRAGLRPREFDYVEAHATGTVVGDRIEGNAISRAFGGGRAAPLRVASVKSNIGHMEAAAFHCSFLKVLLMMERRVFAPISRNYLSPNPEIDFDGCPMRVQTTCEPFPEHPVTVGINSFGFGGANGHCVLREYHPERPRIWSIPVAPDGGHMIPLSARSREALVRVAGRLREAIGRSSPDLYALAGGLSRRTTFFPVRTSFAARDPEGLVASLEAFEKEPEPIGTAEEGDRRIVMVFSGQGTQWSGCGRELHAANPVFRRAADRIEEIWREHADFSLLEALFDAPGEELDRCRLAQPAIFLVQCALTELLAAWGVHPDCVVGHSSGEVAAAYACGMLTLEEATALIHHRSRLQQTTAGSGRMLAVGLDRPGVVGLLEEYGHVRDPSGGRLPEVQIACENSPAGTVVCGREDLLRPIVEELERRGLQHRLLPGDIAFHSSAMDPIREEVIGVLSPFLDGAAFEARLPMISSVTGEVASRTDAAYWWANIRETVHFARAMETVHRDFRPDIVLEVSPHGALRSTVLQCSESLASPPTYVPTLMRGAESCGSFLETLGSLFRAGVDLDHAAWYPRPEPIVHLLPGYPREEKGQFNPRVDDVMFVRQGEYSHGPMVGHKVRGRSDLFEARISESDFPYLLGHRVHHAAMMPAASYLEMVLEAMGGAPVRIEEAEFLQPCAVKAPRRLQTELLPVGDSKDEFDFRISSRTFDVDAPGEMHCKGRVRRADPDERIDVPMHLADLDMDSFDTRHIESAEEFYERISTVLDNQFEYTGEFRVVRSVRYGSGCRSYLVDVEMDEGLFAAGRREGYHFCPPMLDGGLQLFLYHLINVSDLFAIPRRAREVTFLGAPTSPRLTVHAVRPGCDWLDHEDRGQYIVRTGERSGGSLRFYDTDTGALLLHIGDYLYFTSNPKWNKLRESKHLISWQPRWIDPGWTPPPDLSGAIGPEAVIAALGVQGSGDPRFLHVAEIAGGRAPEGTLLNGLADPLAAKRAPLEYWLLGESPEGVRAHFDAFRNREMPLRFESLNLAEAPPDPDSGLLREAGVDLFLLHREAGDYPPEAWRHLRRLAVSGALALAVHEEGDRVEPPEGWDRVRIGGRSTLLQAREDAGEAAPLPVSPRWIIGEPGSPAGEWAALAGGEGIHRSPWEDLSPERLHRMEDWPDAAGLRAIDFFCGGEDPDDPTGEALAWRVTAFLQALVAWRGRHAREDCRLTLVTRRAAFEVDHPRARTLWGALRSIASETGEECRLDHRMVDIGGPEDLRCLRRLCAGDLRERELAIRRGRLWAPRLLEIRERVARVPEGEDAAWRLRLDNPGQLSGLVMKALPVSGPGPEEIEVDIAAAGLNFRDVMVALGLLPSLAFERSALGYEVGMEAGGTVRRVGSAVTDFKPGDEVVFIEGGCIANRIVLDRYRVFRKPERLSPEEAATSLSAYVTAYYSLIHLARLGRGQRVLVHSAMGGVGQAAIALARHVGAGIYATAGSPEKRARLLELGAVAAFDSRSHDWYGDLMEATGGEGVDVVLNSLAGRHISLCLSSLRPGGWHCEIGKVDILADGNLGLRVFRRNLRFAAIDVDRLLCDDPVLARRLSEECLHLLGEGKVPPLPITLHPCGEYEKALRLMMSGRHQGKLALQVPSSGLPAGVPVVDLRPFLDPDATYLVTGGLGGFGMRVVSYLSTAGARHLTLMDRDPGRSRTPDRVRRMSPLVFSDRELEIDIVPGDVTREEDVRRCIAGAKRPIRGVFHLAGALDDRFLMDISEESVRRVFAPKARGAWNLHRATEGLDLDHFVLLSSIASTFGNFGQTPYSAASSYLDGLAAHRRRRGLPGLSYSMAGVGETGMALRNPHVLRLMRANGIPPISCIFAIANLDYAMRMLPGRDHLISALIEHPPWTVDSPDYMRTGMRLGNQAAFSSEEAGDLTVEGVAAGILEKVGELCGHDEGGVDEPLSGFGLNSISVTELGGFIQSRFRYKVSALDLMTTASCRSLARAIMERGREKESGGEVVEKRTSAEGAPRRRVRRAPSRFAVPLRDHFPPGTSLPTAGREQEENNA